jgi:hypothetical protein
MSKNTPGVPPPIGETPVHRKKAKTKPKKSANNLIGGEIRAASVSP